jgi:hypothetical protein
MASDGHDEADGEAALQFGVCPSAATTCRDARPTGYAAPESVGSDMSV